MHGSPPSRDAAADDLRVHAGMLVDGVSRNALSAGHPFTLRNEALLRFAGSSLEILERRHQAISPSTMMSPPNVSTDTLSPSVGV